MPALVAGIHVFGAASALKTWMAGTGPGHDGDIYAFSDYAEQSLDLLDAGFGDDVPPLDDFR
jgi:hypothetical protein